MDSLILPVPRTVRVEELGTTVSSYVNDANIPLALVEEDVLVQMANMISRLGFSDKKTAALKLLDKENNEEAFFEQMDRISRFHKTTKLLVRRTHYIPRSNSEVLETALKNTSV